MERKIKIFRSFEEQEEYFWDGMLKSTPLERFQRLYRMQQITLLFHPPLNKARRILIHKHGHS